jgi:hypothetical protein
MRPIRKIIKELVKLTNNNYWIDAFDEPDYFFGFTCCFKNYEPKEGDYIWWDKSFCYWTPAHKVDMYDGNKNRPIMADIKLKKTSELGKLRPKHYFTDQKGSKLYFY